MKPLLKLALLTVFGLGTQGISASGVAAATFGQREIHPDRVIAVASPVGEASHQLLILEQLSDRRPCWRESGPTVDPLLLEFDFTGICGRGTDSNGYSLRVGGEDLGWRYSLRVINSGNTLRLVASSNTDRSQPPIEIGRATLTDGEMVEIELNPGWRLTKRVYNGQTLGHYYLTHDQNLETLIAAAPAPTPIIPTPQPTPLVPRPADPAVPTRPLPPPDAPTATPAPRPAPSPAPSPAPVSPNPTDGPPPPPSDYASRLGFSYRVVVPASNSMVQSRVRAVVPDAFRTTINGEVMMQAGLFRDRTDAEALRQRLRLYNLAANVLEIARTGIDSPGATPQPSDPPRQPTPTPNPLPIPATRTVIVIDPGHGGRDPGAIGRGGLREAPTVLDISQRVRQILEQQGVQVVMTRTGDTTVDLEPRVAIARRADADLFVSIHANAISMSRPEVNGLETFYYSSQSGYRLAQSIQRSMVESTGMVDRGVKEARFYVIRNTPMPAVLVETGFVTGANDAPRLADPNFRQQMAEAIARGILNYLR